MCVYCWTLLSVSTACNVQRVAPSCPSSARTPCSVRTASASIHAVQQLQPFDLVLFLSVTPPFHCCSFFSFIPPPFCSDAHLHTTDAMPLTCRVLAVRAQPEVVFDKLEAIAFRVGQSFFERTCCCLLSSRCAFCRCEMLWIYSSQKRLLCPPAPTACLRAAHPQSSLLSVLRWRSRFWWRYPRLLRAYANRTQVERTPWHYKVLMQNFLVCCIWQEHWQPSDEPQRGVRAARQQISLVCKLGAHSRGVGKGSGNVGFPVRACEGRVVCGWNSFRSTRNYWRAAGVQVHAEPYTRVGRGVALCINFSFLLASFLLFFLRFCFCFFLVKVIYFLPPQKN